jgi:hypothetical protein
MASRITSTRCSQRRPVTSLSASPAGMAWSRPTRSADSTSWAAGVMCIHRTRLPPLSTIRALEKSLIHGGMSVPRAGHSLLVRWA